jgi:hypothetical protein
MITLGGRMAATLIMMQAIQRNSEELALGGKRHRIGLTIEEKRGRSYGIRGRVGKAAWGDEGSE